MGNIALHEYILIKTNWTDATFKLDMGVQANVLPEAMAIALL